MSAIDTEDIITNHHCSGGGHLVGCNGPEGDYCLVITLADEIDALRAKVAAVDGPAEVCGAPGPNGTTCIREPRHNLHQSEPDSVGLWQIWLDRWIDENDLAAGRGVPATPPADHIALFDGPGAGSDDA